MGCLGGGVRLARAAAGPHINRQTCQQGSHSSGQINPPSDDMGFHPRRVSQACVAEYWRDGGGRFLSAASKSESKRTVSSTVSERFWASSMKTATRLPATASA